MSRVKDELHKRFPRDSLQVEALYNQVKKQVVEELEWEITHKTHESTIRLIKETCEIIGIKLNSISVAGAVHEIFQKAYEQWLFDFEDVLFEKLRRNQEGGAN